MKSIIALALTLILAGCLTPNRYPVQPLAPENAGYVIETVTVTPERGEERMANTLRETLASQANARRGEGRPARLSIAITETYDTSGVEEAVIGNASYADVHIRLETAQGRSLFVDDRRLTVGADNAEFGDPLLDLSLNWIANFGTDESAELGRQIASVVKSELLDQGVRLAEGAAYRR